MPSTEYDAAIAKHNVAIHAYEAVRDAYRANLIGDTEYLAARAAYQRANAEFDVAYAAEQDREVTA